MKMNEAKVDYLYHFKLYNGDRCDYDGVVSIISKSSNIIRYKFIRVNHSVTERIKNEIWHHNLRKNQYISNT